MLRQNEDVFKEKLRAWRGCQLRSGSPVPYFIKGKVEHELEILINHRKIEPVKFVEWAVPTVPVLKPDNSVHVCGDYKLSQHSVKVGTPVPKLGDLFGKTSGGEEFSELDLNHEYQKIILD